MLAAGGVYCYGPDGTLWGTQQTESRPPGRGGCPKTVLLTASSASELQFSARRKTRRQARAALRRHPARPAQAAERRFGIFVTSFGKEANVMDFSPAILLDIALVGVVVF